MGTTVNKTVSVYVCPDPSCSNYYGGSSMGDLAKLPNHRTSMRNLADEDPKNWGMVTGYRDECPDCRARGATTRRQLVTVTVAVPAGTLANAAA